MGTIYAATIALFWQQMFKRLIVFYPSADSPSPTDCLARQYLRSALPSTNIICPPAAGLLRLAIEQVNTS
jgi:hypothetical protein